MRPALLFAMVLVIATAGLVYELVMAAIASYLLGDSVRQFSLVIGVYLSALGLGAYFSRFVGSDLIRTFVDVELGTALVGGLCAPVLFLAHALSSGFKLVLFVEVTLVGVLVGLELPLLLRILERRVAFKELVARALGFDYAGALLGSLAFSLVFVPELGLVHTSLVCGLMNAGVGLASTYVLYDARAPARLGAARIRAYFVLIVLGLGCVFGSRVTELSDSASYPGRVIFARQSAYQRIVLSESGQDLSLYLNGHLQFSSSDEYRYHEALVHPALLLAENRRRVFVGGGGDGLALRELLKWPDVTSITIVDLDREVTDLARSHPRLRALNRDAFRDPRVTLANQDAERFLAESSASFDVMLFDFPDPANYSIGKLYSLEFYRKARARLSPRGIMVVQATSPLFARAAFWCVARTLEAAGLQTLPYHEFVPAFGEWGFVLASQQALAPPTEPPRIELRHLDAGVLAGLFQFPRDMARVDVLPNRLNNQALVAYYLDDWSRWN